MSVNKFMHPRNIYKNPPNFKQMAIDFPEFRKHVQQDITGKIKIDFKNNEALCALTRTLLKKDFDLNVIIPSDRLIPTVPLRLNYVLWIEDLLSISNELNSESETWGIDIGTGASCVYPLLAARLNKWHMLATEVDVFSFETARENAQRNNLAHLITVKQTDGDTFLKNVTEPGRVYHFCMCNPPFFAHINELDPGNKARTSKRCLPRNAPSGTPGEVVVQGGEVEFISKLIRESVEMRSQIRIFSTMVGQKSSLPPLKVVLRSVDVVSFKQTEFHQGHTTRWGLAWTFFNLDLRTVPLETVAAKKKLKPPQKYVLPASFGDLFLEDVVGKMRDLFQTLHMEYEELKRSPHMFAYQVTARENTWSHQRRKRRQQQRKTQHVDQHNSSIGSNGTDCTGCTEISDMEVVETSLETAATPEEAAAPEEIAATSEVPGPHKRHRDADSDAEDEEYYNMKKIKSDEHREKVLLQFNTLIRKLAGEYHLELSWTGGEAGWDSLHQVMQYFKNNLK